MASSGIFRKFSEFSENKFIFVMAWCWLTPLLVAAKRWQRFLENEGEDENKNEKDI